MMTRRVRFGVWVWSVEGMLALDERSSWRRATGSRIVSRAETARDRDLEVDTYSPMRTALIESGMLNTSSARSTAPNALRESRRTSRRLTASCSTGISVKELARS